MLLLCTKYQIYLYNNLLIVVAMATSRIVIRPRFALHFIEIQNKHDVQSVLIMVILSRNLVEGTLKFVTL